MTVARIDARFAQLRREARAGFVAYVMAGDPDAETALEILRGLPAAGADLIELGFPFSDPMAEGVPIQRAAQRALAGRMTLRGTLELVRAFRSPFPLEGGRAGDGGGEASRFRSEVQHARTALVDAAARSGDRATPNPDPSPLQGEGSPDADLTTPLILMGYLNPLLAYGFERFARDAAEAGVDGLIVVDCPPEEADPLADALDAEGIALIRLATPTSDDARLKVVTRRTSGFVYYVSVAGVTGTKEADAAAVAPAVERVRKASGLPVAVGFGIKTPERAAEVARVADAAVVGSALIDELAAALEAGQPPARRVLSKARALSEAVRTARTRDKAES